MMRNGRRYRQHGGYVHTWFVVCLIIGGIGSLVGSNTDDPPLPDPDCAPITMRRETSPEWQQGWDALLDQGWQQRGDELYPAGCEAAP
jgi:hypothetical protein